MNNKLTRAILYILLGFLFIILKGEVISIAMTAIGIYLIVTGINFIIKKMTNNGIINIVIGVFILIFGWTLVNAAIYIIAALLLIFGLLQIYNTFKFKTKSFRPYIEPIINIVIALCLLLNLGGTINWAFYLMGILFIIEGVLTLIYSK